MWSDRTLSSICGSLGLSYREGKDKCIPICIYGEREREKERERERDVCVSECMYMSVDQFDGGHKSVVVETHFQIKVCTTEEACSCLQRALDIE